MKKSGAQSVAPAELMSNARKVPPYMFLVIEQNMQTSSTVS